MKNVIGFFVVGILSMEIEDWIQSSIVNFMGEPVWRIIRFIGFLILWVVVDALFDAIYQRVANRK